MWFEDFRSCFWLDYFSLLVDIFKNIKKQKKYFVHPGHGAHTCLPDYIVPGTYKNRLVMNIFL